MTGATPHPRHRGARLAAGAAVTALLLAGCAGEVPQPAPEPAATAPLPVLDEDRIERILADVEETVDEADAALDPELLTDRVTGPALAMRQAEYRLSAASDGERTPTPLTTNSQIEVVAATDEWPRSLYVVSHVPDDANLPLLLVLTQEDARSQYKLWFWTTLLPGAQTPSTARPDAGSPQLAPDAEGLLATPQQTVARYAELLADPDGEASALFAEDPFRTGYAEMISALRETVEVAGQVRESYEVREGSVSAMQTAEGGALVVGVIDGRLNLRRTVEGSTLEAGGDLGLLMEQDPRIDGEARAHYLIPVAFSVPPEGSEEPVAVLGATQVLANVGESDRAPEDEEEGDGEG
ncbi:hypothetical protein [Oceanitalea stevensii]|uniref:DUF8094 domain-containing protein n=1 Tax=Oceanitalea stevensii TaxID=2763072 RepID=A0ABR8Z6K9_9MICO|nr:hypothetical protein [Oceanitalea stevensii]MBD8063556.1 hypothetical protein [Oceanitalea stevensii]